MAMTEKEYIERGALIAEYDRAHVGPPGGARKLMVEAPAADVVEAKHGKWIDKPTGSYGRMQSWCSACGKHSGIGGIESNRHKPYCPNCGAKMDGERKEADQ